MKVKLMYLWKIETRYVIANFYLGSINWRINFSFDSYEWLLNQVGQEFEVGCTSITQGPVYIHVHGPYSPGVEAYRGV